MTYTNHNHHIPGSPEDPLPFGAKIHRCGGPGLCALCSKEATAWTIQDLHDKAERREKAEQDALHTPANHATVFQSIPSEIVAIQFTGGGSQGRDIEAWIKANGGNATWREAAEPYHPEGDEPGHDGWPETLQIETDAGWTEAKVGYWVIQGTEGEFYLCRPDAFDRKYEPKK